MISKPFAIVTTKSRFFDTEERLRQGGTPPTNIPSHNPRPPAHYRPHDTATTSRRHHRLTRILAAQGLTPDPGNANSSAAAIATSCSTVPVAPASPAPPAPWPCTPPSSRPRPLSCSLAAVNARPANSSTTSSRALAPSAARSTPSRKPKRSWSLPTARALSAYPARKKPSAHSRASTSWSSTKPPASPTTFSLPFPP